MADTWLLGIWRLMRADPSLGFMDGTRMEFREDGLLFYHIPVDGQELVVELAWRVEGDLLHTDVIGAPHSRTVRLVHGAADLLILDFSGERAMLVREDALYIQNS